MEGRVWKGRVWGECRRESMEREGVEGRVWEGCGEGVERKGL